MSKERLSKIEINKILKYAKKYNLLLDSAEDYPNSHISIGGIKQKLRVATKIDIRKYRNIKDLTSAILLSKETLKQESLEILYIRGGDLVVDEEEKSKIYALINKRESLGINRIGFSIYDEYELKSISRIYGFDFTFQVPYNLANVIFKEAIENLKEKNSRSRFVARSIFLQGLLTVPTNEVPPSLFSVIPLKEWISNKAHIYTESEMEICLRFVINSGLFEAFVIGIQSLNQLAQCKSFLDSHASKQILDISDLPVVRKEHYDPRFWSNS